MALNLRPELVDTRALQANLRAIERHLTDDHYTRGFTPGDFVLDVATFGVSVAWPLIVFADAATGVAYVSFRKPSEWRTGKIAYTVWYTGSVNSTNNVRVVFNTNAIRNGEVLEGTSLLSSTVLLPGPAVAATIIRYGPFYTTTSFGGDDELFSFRITRTGAHGDDTYAGNFLVLYVTVQHVPAVLEAQ